LASATELSEEKFMTKNKISVIIPAKNENFGIKVCLELIALYVDNLLEIIVILESVEDQTIKVIDKVNLNEQIKLKVVFNEYSKGVTGSIQTGIKMASGNYVFIYPADEINPIFALNDFTKKLNSGFDLVSATRYSKGGLRLGVGSFSGNLLSRLVATLVLFVTNGRFSDLSTGIKAFKKDVIEIPVEPFSQNGWSFPMEIELRALLGGKKISEIPIISVDRPFGGESSYHAASWILSYSKVIIKVFFLKLKSRARLKQLRGLRK
jgi:glycosyltransferase involved in cell wall biosynthesis